MYKHTHRDIREREIDSHIIQIDEPFDEDR